MCVCVCARARACAWHVKQKNIPVREAIFESVTIDRVPSYNRSDKPIKTKPKL